MDLRLFFLKRSVLELVALSGVQCTCRWLSLELCALFGAPSR
jgi:hypothetical protein